MDNYTFYMLLLLLFLAIAIHNMYRLRKERDEYRYKYDFLITEILTMLSEQIKKEISLPPPGKDTKPIIGTPGKGREFDFRDFPKSKKEIEKVEKKSIVESNPFSDKIKCLTKHYFTKLPLFSHLITPLMLKKVKDLPIYENKKELQKALEEIKNVFGDDFEIIQNTTLMNLMCFFDELRKFHKMYGLSPEEYYEDNINMLIKWSGSSDEN